MDYNTIIGDQGYFVVKLPVREDNDIYAIRFFSHSKEDSHNKTTTGYQECSQTKKFAFDTSKAGVFYLGDIAYSSRSYREFNALVTHHFDDAKTYLNNHFPKLGSSIAKAKFSMKHTSGVCVAQTIYIG